MLPAPRSNHFRVICFEASLRRLFRGNSTSSEFKLSKRTWRSLLYLILMNAHQLPSVGAADTDSFAKQNQRHSESTTANTRTQTIVGQMSERFDALDARLRKTAIISEGSVTAPGQKTMRKLVDWLLGICWNYSVDEVGLFLSVALLTNFVENRNVERKQLQAVAVTCLLIASKYTQVSKLRLKDAVDLCSGIYSVEQIAQFES